MVSTRRNIIVVGGNYTGAQCAKLLSQKLYASHRVLLIERNTHYQHLYAFPRHAIVPGWEHAAFIPYTNMFLDVPGDTVRVVRAHVDEVHEDSVTLADGEVVPYEYVVLAMGTRLAPPGSLETETKVEGYMWFREHQKKVASAQKVVIVGGGALGVQLASDARDWHSNKDVTLIHSRDHLMNTFHTKLHDLVMERLTELGVKVILGVRVKIPGGRYPNDGSEFDMELSNGETIRADFAVLATGQTASSDPVRTLSPSSIAPSGYISVKRSLQLADERFPRVFVIGDVADTTNAKLAAYGVAHSAVAAENIARMVRGEGEPMEMYMDRVKGIQLSLGIKRKIIFHEPETPEDEPYVKITNDGDIDVGSRWMWKLQAPGLTDYYL